MRDEQFSSKPQPVREQRVAKGQLPARFTRFTSESPRVLSKSFSLHDDKVWIKNGGMMSHGRSETVEVEDLAAFARVIMELTPSQALGYGTCEHSPAQIVTKERLQRRRGSDKGIAVVARTADAFSYLPGPAIMMLDYDPAEDGKILSRDDVVQLIRQVIPKLAHCEMLWIPSASSHIYRGTEELRGLRGQRLYVVLKDGTDIPRAAGVLIDRLWLAGHGRIKVSAAGTMLLRTVLDGAVYQANRLDFAAGAHCEAPLSQKRGEPVLVHGTCKRVDSRTAFVDLTPEERSKVYALQERARAEKQYEAQQKRASWLERRAGQAAGPQADDAEREAIRQDLEAALDERVLSGSFLIPIVVAPGQIEPTSVREILANPAIYDGKLTLDPIEPDYDNGRVVGKLYLSGRKKVLHSFARGETTYELLDERVRINVDPGRLGAATDEVLHHLRQAPDIFDRGPDLVIVEDGELHIFDAHSLQQELDRRFLFWRRQQNGPSARDVPEGLAKRILGLRNARRLKQLKAVLTAPVLRLDRSLLSRPGYDNQTGVYLCGYEGWEDFKLPEWVSKGDVEVSLDRLMAPFGEFPYAAAVDRSVQLAALLTAVCRPMLPTAPAFGYDAPVQGSGKTLLARCTGALATGGEPAMMPVSKTMDDEEIRKRALAMLRQGASVMVWDNVLGHFKSPVAAMMLTSATYTDRILGKTESATFDMRSMLILTGNNLCLVDDMARRVLVCRIDPKEEQPFNRRFEHDPFWQVCQRRIELIRDALIILRGYQQIGRDVRQGRLASFEDWSDLVGATVAWIAADIEPDLYSDPVDALRNAEDPALQDLLLMLRTLKHAFGDREFKANEIVHLASHGSCGPLRGSDVDVHEFAGLFGGTQGTLSASSVASYLRNRKERIVGGLRLVSRPDGHTKTLLWSVELVG